VQQLALESLRLADPLHFQRHRVHALLQLQQLLLEQL
jgi:hypothetical protein